MTPIPETVRILDKTWQVSLEDLSATDSFGLSHRNRLKFILDPESPVDLIRETLLHEIMHGISDELDLGLEEKQISRLSAVLFHVLNCNPALVDYLLAEE